MFTATGTFRNAFFGQGTGPIQLDNVACRGSESRLIDCNRGANPGNVVPGIGESNCDHTEDAGAGCFGTCSVSCFTRHHVLSPACVGGVSAE